MVDPAGRSPRLDSLTGLRAAAALGVFISHIGWVVGDARVGPLGTLHRITDRGGLGVAFFFVLSGFVLFWSAKPHTEARRFYGRRIARIYPAHLVTWVLFALLFAAGLATSAYVTESVWGALASLLLVQAWFPQVSMHFAWNSPSWSLSAEMFFYLCFPVLIGPVRRLGHRGTLGLAAGCLAFPFALAVILRLAGADSLEIEFVARTLPLMRLPEFVLGMALAALVRGGRLPRLPLLPVLVAGGVGWILTRWVPVFPDAMAVALAAPVIVAAAQQDLAGRSSFWSRPTIVHLGVISYAFYLVHDLTIRTARNLWPGYTATPLHAAVIVGACLAASVAAAEAIYHFVERPAERYLRRRLDPGAGAPAIDPSVDEASAAPSRPSA